MNSLIFTKKGIVYSIIFFVMFPLCFQCALLVERGEDSLHEIMWDVSWASYLLGIWPLISGVLAGTYMIVMMALHRKLSASCPAGDGYLWEWLFSTVCSAFSLLSWLFSGSWM